MGGQSMSMPPPLTNMRELEIQVRIKTISKLIGDLSPEELARVIQSELTDVALCLQEAGRVSAD